MNTRKTVGAVLAVAGLGLIMAAPANATQPTTPKKVWVCHATSSDTNPYRIIHVSVNSTKYEGHLAHKTSPNKKWKSDGEFAGVQHVKNDPKPDIIGEPGDAQPPEQCGGEVVTATTTATSTVTDTVTQHVTETETQTSTVTNTATKTVTPTETQTTTANPVTVTETVTPDPVTVTVTDEPSTVTETVTPTETTTVTAPAVTETTTTTAPVVTATQTVTPAAETVTKTLQPQKVTVLKAQNGVVTVVEEEPPALAFTGFNPMYLMGGIILILLGTVVMLGRKVAILRRV